MLAHPTYVLQDHSIIVQIPLYLSNNVNTICDIPYFVRAGIDTIISRCSLDCHDYTETQYCDGAADTLHLHLQNCTCRYSIYMYMYMYNL